jgi:hypothetical protein
MQSVFGKSMRCQVSRQFTLNYIIPLLQAIRIKQSKYEYRDSAIAHVTPGQPMTERKIVMHSAIDKAHGRIAVSQARLNTFLEVMSTNIKPLSIKQIAERIVSRHIKSQQRANSSHER